MIRSGRWNAQFTGSRGNQVVKVFELAIGGTGHQEEEPRKAGSDRGSDRVPISPPFWITKLIIVAPRKSFFESAEIKVLDGFSVLS